MVPDLRSIRHRRQARGAVAVGVALALGGCTLPSMSDFEVPGNDPSFRTRVYAGASMGNSRLTPDTRGTVFNVDDSDDLGTQLRLGVDVHNMLAVELDTSVLGTATLREAGTDVNYSAAAISALVYGLNGVQLRSRREGWSAYGRLGMGLLKRSSAVVDLEESGSGPILGLGAEYGLSSGVGIRGEITRFDDDAVHLGLGAVYRFGVSPREVGGLIAEVAAPVLASSDRRVREGGRTLARRGRFGQMDDDTAPDATSSPRGWATGTFSRWRPPALADDRDRDGVRDVNDRCPESGGEITVDRVGCGLFDGVLTGVVFKSGSHWLTARARGELDAVAERLLAFPEARVRVHAHTDSNGPADENLALSVRRAEAVVEYLQGRGVAELQLESQGAGETRPLASNGDVEGRRRNRRVEIETLTNLDPMQVAGAASTDDRREPDRRLPPESGVEPFPTAAPVSERTAMSSSGPSAVPDAGIDVDLDAPDGADGSWRARHEPGVGAARPIAARPTAARPTAARPTAARPTAARPTAATAEAAAATTDSRPMPRPGFVPGLTVAGVIPEVDFASGSAELPPAADPALARIADELDRYATARVAIIAHTDDRGAEEANETLSLERAVSVLDRLVELGVDRSRLEAEGYGESLPLVQNVTDEDRARNRRVELRVLP